MNMSSMASSFLKSSFITLISCVRAHPMPLDSLSDEIWERDTRYIGPFTDSCRQPTAPESTCQHVRSTSGARYRSLLHLLTTLSSPSGLRTDPGSLLTCVLDTVNAILCNHVVLIIWGRNWRTNTRRESSILIEYVI